MDRRVEERLDSGMYSQYWSHIFSNAKLLNLVILTSDHTSIMLDLNLIISVRPIKQFHFENSQLNEADYLGVVSEVYGCNARVGFTKKLKKCADTLQLWD